MINKPTTLTALAVIAASAPAHAAVTISTAPTQNMSCSDGTCVPTATKAVLNASDLESDLSQFGNVRVMTMGRGVEANNVEVKAAFATPDSTSLTLESHKAITVNAAVSIGSGTAELELQSDTLAASDTLSFGKKGHITFGSLSDIFGINGGIFTLVGSVQGLASAVAANPSGAFALANSYDASQDGTYTSSPVATTFTGTFEGLGNTISNLSITCTDCISGSGIGLFASSYGSIMDTDLTNASLVIQGNHKSFPSAGGLSVYNYGTVSGVHVSGTIRGYHCAALGGLIALNTGSLISSSMEGRVEGGGEFSQSGGLVGVNYDGGAISLSHTAGHVVGRSAGGLVGENRPQHAAAYIDQSYSEASVIGPRNAVTAGGLVGFNYGDAVEALVSNSYSTGRVDMKATKTERNCPCEGGAIGENGGSAAYTYSTGAVSGQGYIGGFVGYDYDRPGSTDTYWDTDTSGITNLSQGAGNWPNDPGITGLTTEQLQSGLPTGFDPKIWTESPNINNGLPYLINNPPPK